MSKGVRRPVLRWYGGKWNLAPWIIRHFPPHRVYVEPYGGAASVLLRKERSYAEVWNELDEAAVNLFQVMRDPEAAERLREGLRLTAFARAEFELAYAWTDDPVEMARRLIVRSFMGFGSNSHNAEKRTGFRAVSYQAGRTPAHVWMNYPDALEAAIERLRGVTMENRPALEVMASHDGRGALHYVDPPYLLETRSPKVKEGRPYHCYAHEMSAEEHAELLAALKDLSGMVVLSGYPSRMYDEALRGWLKVERAALADGARPRVEVLWLNPEAAERQAQPSFNF